MYLTKKAIVLFIALCISIPTLFSQNYCDISFVNDDFEIRDVNFATSEFYGWFHKIPFMGLNNYNNFVNNPSYWMYVEPGQTYSIKVKTIRSNMVSGQVMLHADWDANGTFESQTDLGTNNDIDYDHTGTFTVPVNAVPGKTRIRIVLEMSTGLLPVAEACGTKVNGTAIDYQVVVRDGQPMTYQGIEFKTIQNPIFTNTPNNNFLLGVNIKTTGGQNNLSVKQIKLDCNRSTNFINDTEYIRTQYSKGHNSAFSYTYNASASVAASNNIIPFNSIYQDHLLPGDNWFWFTVDLKNTATVGNTITPELTDIILDNNGSSISIPITGISSTRAISGLNYCKDNTPHGRAFYHIDSVRISNLSFSNFEPQTKSSIYYQNSFTPYVKEFDLCTGNEYDLAIRYNYKSTLPSAMFVHAYFDWNQDGDFDEANEHYFLSNDISSPINGYNWARAKIKAPKGAKSGISIMRIATSGNMTPSPCVDIGETQDFGYLLHSPGELAITNNLLFINQPQPVNLSSSNISSNVNYQYSYDGIVWNTYSGSNNQPSFITPTIDTTTLFRLISDNDLCPNNENISNIIALPYVGLKALPDTINLCLTDTAILTAAYNYRPYYFFNDQQQADATDLFLIESEILVNNIQEQHLNYALLDSVCVTLKHSSPVSMYLYPPNSNKELKIRLAENVNYNDPNDPTSSVLQSGKYCFVTDNINYTPIGTNNTPGTYTALEGFERLYGINPNGTWTLMLYGENAQSQEIFESFELYFGTENKVAWSPDSSISSLSDDTVKIYTNHKQLYYASLINKFGTAIDSTLITPVSGNNITLNINPIDEYTLCQGSEIVVNAVLSEPTLEEFLIWKKNGSLVPTQNGLTTYTSNQFTSNDKIEVIFNMNASCRNYSLHDEKTLIVSPPLSPSVDVIPNLTMPLCLDETELTFFADTANFGNKPATIQWFINNELKQLHGKLFNYEVFKPEDTVKTIVSGNSHCLSQQVFNITTPIKFVDSLDANFLFTPNGLSYSFTPSIQNYTSYYWDFGNGNTSSEITPEFVYEEEGTYTTCLTVTNEYDCNLTYCEQINVLKTNTSKLADLESIFLFPNPTHDLLWISGIQEEVHYSIYHLSGELVLAGKVSKKQPLTVAHLPAGGYSIQLSNNNQLITKSFIKQ